MPRICPSTLWSERSIYQIPKHSGHREGKKRLQGEIGIPERCWCDRWHPYTDKSSTDKPRRLFQPEALLQLRRLTDRRCIRRVFVFVDSTYPLKSWLMRPLQDNGALTPAQRHFNRELSQACIVVEHGFDQTKARWRYMNKRLDEDTRIPATITACCVLHNICIALNDEFNERAGVGFTEGTTS